MPRSMTGFGVADGPLAGGRIEITIRTVNHRHFNVQLRLPSLLQPFEDAVREALRARIERGHVSVSGRWSEDPAAAGPVVTVDIDRARAVVEAVAQLKRALDLPGDVDVAFVARQPEVLAFNPARETVPLPTDALLEIVGRALDGVIDMRTREGDALGIDLAARLAGIDRGRGAVVERAPARLLAERDRLRQAVTELLDQRPVNEDRLAQELAYVAERLDVSEELVRLQTHLVAARSALAGDAPAGKTLGFLSQEMLREINTIGSKANDAEIAAHVIAMKGELEKFREQLENVE